MNTINFANKVIAPSKIVCVGRNYVEHIYELGNEIPDEMVIFNKSNSALSGELHSFLQEPIHYEGELCFLYQGGKFVAVGFGLDLTKRGLQAKLKAKGLPWERAKSFDQSVVLSDFVAIDKINASLSLELSINHTLTQQGEVELMMYKPEDILAELATFLTLEDGDVVMTGTPKGVGLVNRGDRFAAKIVDADTELLSCAWTAL